MNRTRLIPLVCLLLLAGCAPETGESDADAAADSMAVGSMAAAEPSGPAFLALHLYNPASEEAHADFLSRLADLNEAIASTGLAETQYGVWQVSGEQSGNYEYAFGSIWPDRATYDAVHDHEAYRAVMSEFEESGLEPFSEEVYNRYVLLNPNPAGPTPVPTTLPSFSSMHRLNLHADSVASLIALLEVASEAVASAGHPETRYGLWKIANTEEQHGDYAYVFGSLWADRATYDAVHEHEAYQAAEAQHGEAYRALVTDEVSNQYERVTVE